MNDGVYFVIKISRIKTTCLFVPYINNSEALLVYREASWPHIQCRDTTWAAQWQQATVGVAAAAAVFRVYSVLATDPAARWSS